MAQSQPPAVLAAINAVATAAVNTALRDVHLRFAAYDNVIAVLIGALAKTGALPIAAAQQELQDAAARLDPEPTNAPLRDLLLRLSALLQPAAALPGQRH